MVNTNRDYLVTLLAPLNRSAIKVDRDIFFYQNDKESCNIFVLVEEGNIEDNYTLLMNIVTPGATREEKEGIVLTPTLLDKKQGLYEIQLPTTVTTKVGTYNCEFENHWTANGADKVITTEPFKYKVYDDVKGDR